MHLLVAFLIPLESSMLKEVHGLCLVMFRPMVRKTLNLEVFINLKITFTFILAMATPLGTLVP